MELHEYQAKTLFRKFGIFVPESGLAETPEQAFDWAQKNPFPSKYVVKAQVHAGGRGKAGGIQKASSAKEVQEKTKQMIGQRLVTPQTGKEGKVVHKVMVEPALDIKRELYLSLLFDRSLKSLFVICSAEGGMSIEELAIKDPKKICKIPLDPALGLLDFQIFTILKSLNLPLSFFAKLKKLMTSLFQLIVEKEGPAHRNKPLSPYKRRRLSSFRR